MSHAAATGLENGVSAFLGTGATLATADVRPTVGGATA